MPIVPTFPRLIRSAVRTLLAANTVAFVHLPLAMESAADVSRYVAFSQRSQVSRELKSSRNQRQQEDRCIRLIEDFLNTIRTWRADFLETDSQGRISRGIFLLKKSPAMMKMDYIDPATRVIVVKNHKVIFYDKELKEKSITSVHSSPLSFFLDYKIDLKENVSIIDCEESNGKLIAVFRKKDDKNGEKGVIRIVFRILSNSKIANSSQKNDQEKRKGRKGDNNNKSAEDLANSVSLQLESWEVYRNVQALNFENPVTVYLENQVINQRISDEEFK